MNTPFYINSDSLVTAECKWKMMTTHNMMTYVFEILEQNVDVIQREGHPSWFT